MKKSSGKTPYGSIKYKTIDEYHAAFPENIKAILDKLREIIRLEAPQTAEGISYNMPAFKLKRVLVYYAVHKEHIGFYPTPGPIIAFKNELAKFKTSKGAIQFPVDKPLPATLIRKIVKFRLKEESEQTPTIKSTAKGKDVTHYHKDRSIWAKGKMLGDKMHGYWELQHFGFV